MNNLSTTDQTKTVKAAEVEKSVKTMQQRSLIKQFESMDLVKKDQQKTSGFVVNTLTTASQRANSKTSNGSSNSFVQKLVGQSKLIMAGAQTAGTPVA